MRELKLPTYYKIFDRKILVQYPADTLKISSDVKTAFLEIRKDIAFIKWSGNPIDRRLEFCAFFLALIRVLDDKGETYANIRKICLDVVVEYVRPKNKLHAFIKKAIPRIMVTPLGRMFIKRFQKQVSRNKSKDGFIANIITDKRETFGMGYGVDIIECGICKLFEKHNYYKYAAILCEVDEVTSKLAGLQLVRTGTIATGASKCDFRYRMRSG